MNRTIGYVSLIVPNYDEAKIYYTRALGFDLVEDTDLGRIGSPEIVDELPDHAGAYKRDGHRHEDEGFGDVAPRHTVGQHSDDESQGRAHGGDDEQPQQVVSDRLEKLAVVEGPGVISEADKIDTVLIVKAEDHGLNGRIDEVYAQDE